MRFGSHSFHWITDKQNISDCLGSQTTALVNSQTAFSGSQKAVLVGSKTGGQPNSSVNGQSTTASSWQPKTNTQATDFFSVTKYLLDKLDVLSLVQGLQALDTRVNISHGNNSKLPTV